MINKYTYVKEADVWICNDCGAHGITKEDIASGKFLHFAKSPEHCIEDVDSGSNQMGIFLNAIRSEELFRRVLKGDRMPQKSTYFFPKTLSGLVMYSLDRKSF